jgi:diguanylate cyclase (GGDEF)-like protein/PAS domain S-box-containing protein
MLSLLPDGAAVLDGTGNVLGANQAFAMLASREPGDVIGRPWHIVGASAHRARALRALVQCVKHGVVAVEMAGVPDGAERIRVTLLKDPERDRIYCTVRDVAKCQGTCFDLHRYRSFSELTHEAIFYLSPEGVILDANPGAHRMYGVPPGSLAGRHFGELQEGDDRTWLNATGKPLVLEYTHKRSGGRTFPVELTVEAEGDGRHRRLLATVRDISDRRDLERHALHAAYHDDLTGLANRSLFTDRLNHTLAASPRRESRVGVLYIDIDRFGAINETLGSKAADRVLAAVSGRVSRCLRIGDTCSRYVSDEFALLLDSVHTEADVVRVAGRILRRMAKPVQLDDNEVFVGVSIGAAVSLPGETADELVQRAAMAMKAAKQNGKGCCVVASEEGVHTSPDRIQLEADLHRAAERNEFSILYQPIVHMDTGRTLAFEALARWRHPRKGLIAPDEFVPVQEQIGLVDAFTTWVLETAQRQCLACHEAGLRIGVSVNLSTTNVLNLRFPAQVEETLSRTGLAPSWLRLEVTEAAVMKDPRRALQVISELAGMGVRLVIDDFGTGFSSLALLKQLPAHEIKVDRSFIRGLDENDEDDTAIVRATIDLAHNLYKKVVAEGVETRATYDLLRTMGCDAVQGYFIARPMTPEAMTEWLQTSEWGVPCVR